MRALAMLPVAFSLALAAGCQGYKVVQTVHFISDDGDIVRVDYGRSEKDHVNTFMAPAMNGRPAHEMEFKSKLAVNVTMPDGDDFTAWQCMLVTRGTTYCTDDKEWYFQANGFTCQIARLNEKTDAYEIAFQGVVCNTPMKKAEKDPRWRKLGPNER